MCVSLSDIAAHAFTVFCVLLLFMNVQVMVEKDGEKEKQNNKQLKLVVSSEISPTLHFCELKQVGTCLPSRRVQTGPRALKS